MTLSIGGGRIPFRLKNVDGGMVSSEEPAGRSAGTALIFSCNHCPYVQAWEDRIISLANVYQPRGVRFLLVNSNDPGRYPEDSFPEMQKRSAARHYPFPYLHDEDQSVARAYGAARTPEIFLFDGSGVLRYHGRVDDNYENPDGVRSHDFRNALEAVVSGRTPVTPETPPVGCTIKWRP